MYIIFALPIINTSVTHARPVFFLGCVLQCRVFSKENSPFKGEASRFAHLKVYPKLFKFVVYNPCQSSPSLIICVSLWFIIISLVFSYLS